MSLTERRFAPVRKAIDDGHEWLDMSASSGDPTVAWANAGHDNKRLPGWAAANPVVRMATLLVTEVAS